MAKYVALVSGASWCGFTSRSNWEQMSLAVKMDVEHVVEFDAPPYPATDTGPALDAFFEQLTRLSKEAVAKEHLCIAVQDVISALRCLAVGVASAKPEQYLRLWQWMMTSKRDRCLVSRDPHQHQRPTRPQSVGTA